MKNRTATTQPKLPAAAPAAAPVPVLDLKRAKSVPAYRHTTPARTVAYHQPSGDAGVHLFSATGNFVATVSEEVAAANEPAPAAPAADTPAAS